MSNDTAKLLDNGWRIVMFRNALGSYTVRAKRKGAIVETDDFTPARALYRAAEKVTTGRIVT